MDNYRLICFLANGLYIVGAQSQNNSVLCMCVCVYVWMCMCVSPFHHWPPGQEELQEALSGCSGCKDHTHPESPQGSRQSLVPDSHRSQTPFWTEQRGLNQAEVRPGLFEDSLEVMSQTPQNPRAGRHTASETTGRGGRPSPPVFLGLLRLHVWDVGANR